MMVALRVLSQVYGQGVHAIRNDAGTLGQVEQTGKPRYSRFCGEINENVWVDSG